MQFDMVVPIFTVRRVMEHNTFCRGVRTIAPPAHKEDTGWAPLRLQLPFSSLFAFLNVVKGGPASARRPFQRLHTRRLWCPAQSSENFTRMTTMSPGWKWST